jgi:hypothetical protein
MGVIENMKDIAELVKKAGDIDLYRKIVESEGQVVDLTRENRRLEEKVQQLEKTLALRGKMTFKEPFWYQEGDETPLCSACHETKDKSVHLKRVSENRWDCPSCNQMYPLKRDAPHSPSGPRQAGGPNSWMG